MARIISCFIKSSPVKFTRFCCSKTQGDTQFRSMNQKPVNVLVTGAAGQIGYSILPRIARGDAFGIQNFVNIKMFDVPMAEKVMHGVRMEIEDCAFKNVKSVEVHTDPIKAFSDVDFIVMLANAMELKAGMTRVELLKENLRVYRETANILKKTGHKDLRILMVANPANTNALLLVESLNGIVPAKNITSLSRLDHNRSVSMLARKIGVQNNSIAKVIVWGNHSPTMVPDINHATVLNNNKSWVNVGEILEDKTWINDSFIPAIRDRVNAIIAARGKSSSLSAASAAIDHINGWMLGDNDGNKWNSMGVYIDSSCPYDFIPRGIVFSMPCICSDGEYRIVNNLRMSPEIKAMLEISAKELINEKSSVF